MSSSIATELAEASRAVEEASIPDDLRSVGFIAAFWAAREQHRGDGGPPAQVVPRANASAAAASAADLQANLGQVATKLGASLEGVEFVYEIEAEKLALRFPPSRLAPVKKEAVKQIIYLVSAGRQAAGLDEKTPAKVIRALCAEMGKDDSNFSRLVDDLHGEGLIVGGSGQAKTIRVNADGFERAGRIVDELRERST